MSKLMKISAVLLFILSIGFSACTQDETMDEIIDNTEINAPSDPDDDGEGGKDTPIGGN